MSLRKSSFRALLRKTDYMTGIGLQVVIITSRSTLSPYPNPLQSTEELDVPPLENVEELGDAAKASSRELKKKSQGDAIRSTKLKLREKRNLNAASVPPVLGFALAASARSSTAVPPKDSSKEIQKQASDGKKRKEQQREAAKRYRQKKKTKKLVADDQVSIALSK